MLKINYKACLLLFLSENKVSGSERKKEYNIKRKKFYMQYCILSDKE